MKPLSGSHIRRLFLEFFADKGHEIVPSSPLVPAEDPTLLFTNAGMVQFKQVFLGEETRSYVRAATSQKCVRAGGKHNDLENVGYTARHHTFFEMLGNFSFGDYFKKDAISFAWEFLTEKLELPVDRLWVTVFRDDDEAAQLWPSVTGISPDRVVRLGEKDNFWAMGETGPCGPCSEIIIDQGEEMSCGPDCSVGCDCDRYLELWNLVFMQFFRDETGEFRPLPKPSIDTGMGLERIAAVCQGKHNNFDSDIFAGLMKKIGELSGRTYGNGRRSDVAMRVIADHARAAAFLIADGVLPSNEGRGYVLRRIIRRAVRYGRVLGLREPFMSSVAASVAGEMGKTYPELVRESAIMDTVLNHEESRFAETLEFGLRLLDEEIARLRKSGETTIAGDFIFKLYDTYGFPVDILQDVAREEGLGLDRAGFEAAMAQQRERSKRAHHETVTEELPEIYRQLLSAGKGTTFVGYEATSAEAEVLALVKAGKAVESASEGWSGELVVSRTPFYAESGGQVGDTGFIEWPSGKGRIINTVHRGALIVHYFTITRGTLSRGASVRLDVSEDVRLDTARNHTATHLLHTALKKVLGDHVKQAGSLVTPERLRFDFTHFSAVTPAELRKVEDLVNEEIRRDIAVGTKTMSYGEALEQGAVALFGEKYGETVRLVSIPGFSMELCGGTHLSRTGQIGLFKIVSESSVASGVRRIEAVTAQKALDFVHGLEDIISGLAAELKCPAGEVGEKAIRLRDQVKELEKEVERLKTARSAGALDDLVGSAATIDGVKLVAARIDADDPRTMREIGDKLRDRIGSGIVVLGAKSNGKALLLALVTRDLTKRAHAGNLVKALASIVGGGGGGRPDMAQAGGTKPEKLQEAIEAVPGLVREMLKAVR